MSESDGLHFDHAISITAAPTQVLSAFFDSGALEVWWNVSRSVTAPRPLGIYAVEWDTTPFQDELLGTLGGVFYGTVMEFRHGREFFLADDIFGTHVSSNYEIIAPSSGVSIIQMNGNQGAKSLEYAGNNQATIIWSDTRSGSGNDIYCQKINMNMEKIFSDGGLEVSATSDLETTPRTTFMKNDTSFVIWQSGTESTDIYYNLLTSDGLVFSEHLQLCSFNSSKANPRIKRNQLGEVFIQWIDYRNDPTAGNHYYQRVSHGGNISWDQNGIQLDASGDDHHARFSPGGNRELFVYWERGTFPNVDIMYQGIQSDGSLLLDNAEFVSYVSGYHQFQIHCLIIIMVRLWFLLINLMEVLI